MISDETKILMNIINLFLSLLFCFFSPSFSFFLPSFFTFSLPYLGPFLIRSALACMFHAAVAPLLCHAASASLPSTAGQVQCCCWWVPRLRLLGREELPEKSKNRKKRREAFELDFL